MESCNHKENKSRSRFFLGHCVRGRRFRRREGRGRGRRRTVRWREREKMSDRRGEKGEEVAGRVVLPSHPQTSQHPRARKGATGHAQCLPPCHPRVTQLWCPAPNFPCWQPVSAGEALLSGPLFVQDPDLCSWPKGGGVMVGRAACLPLAWTFSRRPAPVVPGAPAGSPC